MCLKELLENSLGMSLNSHYMPWKNIHWVNSNRWFDAFLDLLMFYMFLYVSSPGSDQIFLSCCPRFPQFQWNLMQGLFSICFPNPYLDIFVPLKAIFLRTNYIFITHCFLHCRLKWAATGITFVWHLAFFFLWWEPQCAFVLFITYLLAF